MLNEYVYVYVEDDPMSRDVMQKLMTVLMKIEHLTVFENSEQIVARVCATIPTPNVFLLDIHLYPIDGFEILRQLKRIDLFEKAIFIALTASVMNDEVIRLRESGFDSAIAKPISTKTFPHLLRRILSGERVWYVP